MRKIALLLILITLTLIFCGCSREVADIDKEENWVDMGGYVVDYEQVKEDEKYSVTVPENRRRVIKVYGIDTAEKLAGTLGCSTEEAEDYIDEMSELLGSKPKELTGVFTVISGITVINEFYTEVQGEEYYIVIDSFGTLSEIRENGKDGEIIHQIIY